MAIHNTIWPQYCPIESAYRCLRSKSLIIIDIDLEVILNI